MCRDEHLFKDLSKVGSRYMSFGDASKAVANGRDTILYLQKDG